jgi:DNA-binding transcriptional LysR family regulator
MIDLRLLQHVIAVAEHGSYRKAAAAVHLSQPALTKSVQQAERHYGVPLFDRRSRPVRPTPAGKVVIEKAHAILSQVESINADLSLLSGLHVRSLAVGAGPMMSEVLLPRALCHLLGKHPAISLHVRIDNWLELNQALNQDAIELYVAAIAQSELQAGMQLISLPAQRASWFCRAGHPLTQRRNLCDADLMSYPIVVPTIPIWSRSWFEDAQRAAGRQAIVHTISEDYTLIKEILAGSDCISAGARYVVADELRRRNFAELEVAGPHMQITAGIVSRRDRTLSPVAQDFIDLLSKVVRDEISTRQIRRSRN